MLADLVEAHTSDGIALGGAYFAPTDTARASSIDALCFFHGDGGHFYDRLYLEMGRRLAEAGIAFLAGNHRGHDIVSNGARGGPLRSYAYESVDEARLDYTAWLDLLRGLGHRRLAVGGHSGGAVRAVYSQAIERFEGVTAVVAVSPGEYEHAGLIGLHADEFTDAFAYAEREMAAGRPDTLLRPGMPWGSTWTARAFVDCFNRDDRYSVSGHAANTGCPALFVFGSEECAGPQELPVCGAAMRKVRSEGYPHVRVEVVEGANHGYQDRETRLYEAIRGWLETV